MSRERKSLVIRLSAIAGALIALGGALMMLARAAEAVRWGERITDVEKSAQALTAGQVALANRMELMGNEVANVKADVARAADRSDRGFQNVLTELARVGGDIRGLVDRTAETQTQLAAVKVQAQNAVVQTDEVRAQIDRLKDAVTEQIINQAKEKK